MNTSSYRVIYVLTLFYGILFVLMILQTWSIFHYIFWLVSHLLKWIISKSMQFVFCIPGSDILWKILFIFKTFIEWKKLNIYFKSEPQHYATKTEASFYNFHNRDSKASLIWGLRIFLPIPNNLVVPSWTHDPLHQNSETLGFHCFSLFQSLFF